MKKTFFLLHYLSLLFWGCVPKETTQKLFTSSDTFYLNQDSTFYNTNKTEFGIYTLEEPWDSIYRFKMDKNVSEEYLRETYKYTYEYCYYINDDSLINCNCPNENLDNDFKYLFDTFKEPILRPYQKSSKEIFRMTIHPFFSTAEIYSIEFNIRDSANQVYLNELQDYTSNVELTYKNQNSIWFGVGGHTLNSTSFYLYLKDSITNNYYSTIQKSIEVIDILNSRTYKHQNYGTDGTMIVLEYLKDGKYNELFRHCGSIETLQKKGYYPNDYHQQEIYDVYKAMYELKELYKDGEYGVNIINKALQ